jgi:hypothetical protein
MLAKGARWIKPPARRCRGSLVMIDRRAFHDVTRIGGFAPVSRRISPARVERTRIDLFGVVKGRSTRRNGLNSSSSKNSQPLSADTYCKWSTVRLSCQEAACHGYPQSATTGRTGSRKIASPPTGLRGTADIGRRPFAGSKSRKQPLDPCRCQRLVDRPLLTTSNWRCRPEAVLQLARFGAAKLYLDNAGRRRRRSAAYGPANRPRQELPSATGSFLASHLRPRSPGERPLARHLQRTCDNHMARLKAGSMRRSA